MAVLGVLELRASSGRRWYRKSRKVVLHAAICIALLIETWASLRSHAFVPYVAQSVGGLFIEKRRISHQQRQDGHSKVLRRATATKTKEMKGKLADQYAFDADAQKSIGRIGSQSENTIVASGNDDFDDAVFDKEFLWEYVSPRPFSIFQRAITLGLIVYGVVRAWQDDAEGSKSKEVFRADTNKNSGSKRGKALRKGLAEMGVFFVKIGQTLAQRPDLVGDDLAEELKGLQEQNEPFDDGVALKIIAEDLNHTGPLAPGVFFDGCDKRGTELLANLGATRIASASICQVYKGTMWDGREVALKVQRPGVRDVLGLDWAIAVLSVQAYQSLKASAMNDYSLVVDTAAKGIRKELDYHEEAANAREFAVRHSFLPFVSSPEWIPELTGPRGSARVLALQWYPSRAPSELSLDERRELVRMAVQSCVIQLLITGFVHADPHEGNLRMGDDGRVVFLDFGLMDRVDYGVMESFAQGIRGVLNEDWEELVLAMQAARFTPTPLLKYVRDEETNEKDGQVVEIPKEELAVVLGKYLTSETGGTSRFGAMATTLKTVSDYYVMLTPPYVALLARTFITLEGMLADDPLMSEQFNIYEAALPFAITRALSPRTPKGQADLRSTFMKGTIPNWEAFVNLLNAAEENQAETAEVTDAASHDSGEALGADFAVSERLRDTSEGIWLRRLFYDMDVLNAARTFLFSHEAKQLRHKAIEVLSQRWSSVKTKPKSKFVAIGNPRAKAAAAGWNKKSGNTGRKAWKMVIKKQLRSVAWPPQRLLIAPVVLAAGSTLALRSALRALRIKRSR